MALLICLKQLHKDARGATAVEYGLIAALISVSLLLALETLGNGIVSTFSTVQAAINID